MKVRNPKNRYDLRIRRSDRVLEVGGGDNPHYRSNVVVDKFSQSNYHRSGDLRLLKKQTFIEADGAELPFKDNEFDYVICCQVLEHVDNPEKFLSELFRVARRGYIETPSLTGEYLFPKASHTWILHELKNTLYLVRKKAIGFNCSYDMGELIQDYLPTHSIGFKIMERTHPNLITIRIEWKDEFSFVVNPQDPEILKYFSGKWKQEWSDDFFPRKRMLQECKDAMYACIDIVRSVIKSKVLRSR